MVSPHKVAQNNIRVMLGDLVEICDLLDHMDIVFLAVLPEFRLEHHKEVIPLLALKPDTLGIGRHLPLPDIDLPLDIPGAVIEHEHIASGLPAERFKSADDGEGMEILALEICVLFQLVPDLMDCHWDYCFVVYGLLFFAFGHHFYGALGYYYECPRELFIFLV